MPHPALRPKTPLWMPGIEAIAHICKVDNCSEADAIMALREAIALGAVRARLPDQQRPGQDILVSQFPTTFAGRIPLRVHRDQSKADIGADGTVAFRGSILRYPLEVLRRDILVWERTPDSAQGRANAPHQPNRRAIPFGSVAHQKKGRGRPPSAQLASIRRKPTGVSMPTRTFPKSLRCLPISLRLGGQRPIPASPLLSQRRSRTASAKFGRHPHWKSHKNRPEFPNLIGEFSNFVGLFRGPGSAVFSPRVKRVTEVANVLPEHPAGRRTPQYIA
jgi:hypothetical protein